MVGKGKCEKMDFFFDDDDDLGEDKVLDYIMDMEEWMRNWLVGFGVGKVFYLCIILCLNLIVLCLFWLIIC